MNITTLLTAPTWSADPARPITDVLAVLDGPSAHDQLTDHLAALDRQLHRHATEAALDRYLAAADDLEARRDRWATVVLVLGAGLLDAAATRPAWPTPGQTIKRPLTVLELGAVRLCSTRCPYAATTIALAEAGATSNELHVLTCHHLDRDDDGWTADLPGDSRTTPRQGRLPGWVSPYLEQVLTDRPEGAPLVYHGSSNDPAKRQSATLMRIRTPLLDAGLTRDCGVTPESIRNTAARRAYARADLPLRLQAAAEVLGIDDLDKVAARIDVTPSSTAADTPTVVWNSPYM